ncbi:MAG TPA: hypothetical protein VFB27_05690 [Opitutaceae bacterium]|nr:hypothetical protein [Opitutaceae bacterium]
MSDFDSDSLPEGEWDERGELAWNEFDWENYLREQDEVIRRYLSHYERLKGQADRIDEVAHLMGWDEDVWGAEDGSADDALDPVSAEAANAEFEPYTLHKNPVFVATKAIYFLLTRDWLRLASDPDKVSQPTGLAAQAALFRGEQQSTLAIQALDLGDYAMAISLFKRALRELNTVLALLDENAAARHRAVTAFREEALPRLFDLREIWLRVMHECRGELERPIEEDDES